VLPQLGLDRRKAGTWATLALKLLRSALSGAGALAGAAGWTMGASAVLGHAGLAAGPSPSFAAFIFKA